MGESISIGTIIKKWNYISIHHKGVFLKNLKFYFSITDYIEYYFVLVSGVLHCGSTIIRFTKWSPWYSSTHLASDLVTTMSLTIFPILSFISPWLFWNYQFVLLNLGREFFLVGRNIVERGSIIICESSWESPEKMRYEAQEETFTS